MTAPYFSIITVTKDNAAGLKLTAKTIAMQLDNVDYEWIILDGASTDNSREIILK